MTKRHGPLGVRTLPAARRAADISIELMIPVQRRAGIAAEMLLVTCTAFAGISAAALSLISRLLETV